VDEALKQSILRNPFVDRLRLEMVVDEGAYRALCDALARLAQAWKGARLVDRELVQDLYVLAPITRNMADPLRERNPEIADRVEEMAMEIDALVLECLDG
jgi:hypothetical protein